MIALGHQTVIEVYNADIKKLSSANIVENIFKMAAKESQATVLWSYFHPFQPQGVSGVVIIAESHFTIHTWPEHRYAAIDIFVCSDDVLINKAIEVFKKEFETEDIIVTGELNRGLLSTNGMAIQPPMSISQPEMYTMSLKKRFEEVKPSAISITANIHDVEVDVDYKYANSYVEKLNKQYDLCLEAEFDVNSVGYDDEEIMCYNYSCDKGTLAIHFDPIKDHLYLDIFSYDFIEPREVSENALYFFKGKNHSFEFFFRQ